MSMSKKISVKKVLVTLVWCLISTGTVLLLTAAVQKNNKVICKGVEVEISGVSKHVFVNAEDVKSIIQNYTERKLTSVPANTIDLHKLEKLIERNVWVNNAQLYFDINGILHVRIHEREPIARIFTKGNETYYIDSSLKILPISDKVNARVPVFTGFPGETAVLNEKDKNLLMDVKNLALYISKDEFLESLIEQVDIHQYKFEFVPKIGDQIIVFGEAENYEEKFKKLKLFYKKAMTKVGFQKYSQIDLQYKDQIVAKIRTREEIKADSLRTIQMMKLIAEYTEKMAEDTSLVPSAKSEDTKLSPDINEILKSVQRDEEPEAVVEWKVPEVKREEPVAVIKPQAVATKLKTTTSPKPQATVTNKPKTETSKPNKTIKPAKTPAATTPKVTQQEKKEERKPKVLMPSRTQRNDY